MKAFITASFHEEGLERLRPHMQIHHEDYRRTGKIYFSEEELIEKIRETGADVLIVEADLVHEEVFAACPLKMIGCCRGDPLNISSEEATRRGIPIFFTPGRNADAVADLTVGFMIDLARNVTLTNLRIRGGKLDIHSTRELIQVFNEYGGFELGGITVGLVGLGAVGKKVAQRLRAFGTRLLVYDPCLPQEAVRTAGALPVGLEELLRNADMVSLHCPDVEGTQGMIGEREFSLMKPTAYFVNTARSILTDEQALLRALQEGRLRGAALDVFDDEPLQADNPFLQLDNVICTAHLGGATRDVVHHQSEMVSTDIVRYLQGEQPLNLWNPEVLKPQGGNR
jgi:phosphoglycerate dehydrogenase-like enzyme